MQNVGYGLADFYISWIRMKRSLSRLSNARLNLPQRFIEALEEREPLLLDTPTMMIAVYLDPRIKYRLNDIQKECATIAAEKLHIRLNRIDTQHEMDVSPNDTLDEMNAEALGGSTNDNNNTNVLLAPLRESICKYDAIKPTDVKSSVFDFWKMRKQEFPLLYELACIVHAVHASQCTVERNFSAFSCVRDCRRCKLLPTNMSNILMIRLNQDSYGEWKSDQIFKIKEHA